ncbi:hypothetical protein IJJ39_00730 [Candidatus Saccharibacteria bacterium]|nr:hypothetical protein [Candidatus Saccharibacteria bacterium]
MKKKFSLARWCDEWVLAAKGILLAGKEKRFWIGFVIAFLFFGTLMNLLSGGFSKFELMGALGFPQNMQIIGSALAGTIGIGMPFLEWLPVFLIAVLQGTLIGLIVLLWDKKRVKSSAETTNVGREQKQESNAANVEKAGIITGLIALGAGCPTCGTTLLTPLLGAIFSTGSFAVAGIISGVVTALAIVIALLSLKRMGEETYVVMINERYIRKIRQKTQKSDTIEGKE